MDPPEISNDATCYVEEVVHYCPANYLGDGLACQLSMQENEEFSSGYEVVYSGEISVGTSFGVEGGASVGVTTTDITSQVSTFSVGMTQTIYPGQLYCQIIPVNGDEEGECLSSMRFVTTAVSCADGIAQCTDDVEPQCKIRAESIQSMKVLWLSVTAILLISNL